ncbi:hypothetical protein PRN20_03610 [Devosia sp. ZB163]|uniref:hypothetical protein n=1 Tax=Devosia sp. ZB163 TaxID=3025938 RepID=UPI0023629859|nr:hypothetical protein [Devosia sp. ZB163]MDC9822809.1 hypothetical protein [Devosia sp. ZB163]
MELTYATPEIRSATNDAKAAQKMLGDSLARSFRSLVADMRNAILLGEVPEVPVLGQADGKLVLNYPLGDSAVLVAEPIGTGVIDRSNWGDVHRVKLLRILDKEKVLA